MDELLNDHIILKCTDGSIVLKRSDCKEAVSSVLRNMSNTADFKHEIIHEIPFRRVIVEDCLAHMKHEVLTSQVSDEHNQCFSFFSYDSMDALLPKYYTPSYVLEKVEEAKQLEIKKHVKKFVEDVKRCMTGGYNFEYRYNDTNDSPTYLALELVLNLFKERGWLTKKAATYCGTFYMVYYPLPNKQ